ncbi:hypothetical protein PDO_1926 [Rhizobium sp. PDO1-076]|uniref:hypothetical protein n=1 Tax=Rhizobium sp. PDO1-076 TaxID=1125979 RepID=UPI00024E3CBA|nr:hypothetical protein [Rhizobium sp. PDO1-076]EHS51304.1 hypothetical protein PDO_1926 [Rhizobium sp. PDO1-076]
MEETEGQVLAGIPMNALALNLTRSTIRMQHTQTWRIDKSNRVHDLVICLTGSAQYEIEGETVSMVPGCAMLLNAETRFVGYSTSVEPYTGIAQHFTLDLFGRLDLMGQMQLKRAVALSRWDMLEKVVRHYRETAPPYSTTLQQHHVFMFLLTEFIEQAFAGGASSRSAMSPTPINCLWRSWLRQARLLRIRSASISSARCWTPRRTIWTISSASSAGESAGRPTSFKSLSAWSGPWAFSPAAAP